LVPLILGFLKILLFKVPLDKSERQGTVGSLDKGGIIREP